MESASRAPLSASAQSPACLPAACLPAAAAAAADAAADFLHAAVPTATHGEVPPSVSVNIRHSFTV